MTLMDVVGPLMVIGLMGEILYFIVSSEAVRGNHWRRSRMRPRRDIAALGRLARRWWRKQMCTVDHGPYARGATATDTCCAGPLCVGAHRAWLASNAHLD
jgi:hypothetical protein